MAIDPSGNIYVAGTTNSTDFPGVNSSSFQSTNGGNFDAFVVKVSAGNTPVGGPPNGVTVSLADAATNTSVTVAFTQVNQPGQTTLVTSSSGPAPPQGFQFGGSPVYYELSTTAVFTGNITVCITSAAVTSSSQLFHFVGGVPNNITSTVSPPTICGVTSSLSPFAVMEPVGAMTVTSVSLVPAASIAYGTASTATVTVTPTNGVGTVAGNVTLSVDGGAPISMPLSNGSATFPLGVLNAGNHALSANFAAQGSFMSSMTNGTLSVTPAPLTLTADNKSKVYGAAMPTLTFSASGFVNGDSSSSLTTQPTLSTTATVASGVGSYPITIGAAVDANYSIMYMPGTLTVTPAVVTITATSLTKVLDAPNPSLPWTPTGFVNGDNTSVLSASPNCTTTATTTSPIGTYPITCGGASAPNYTFIYVPGTLTILYATAIGHVIQPPINADGTSVFKQGRTVPAKFSVYDANGVSIGTPGVVSSFVLTGIVSGTATTTVQDVVDTNNPDTAFRWDGQEWIFNITTGNLTAGSTYIYTITLNDGSTIMFQYGLR